MRTAAALRESPLYVPGPTETETLIGLDDEDPESLDECEGGVCQDTRCADPACPWKAGR